MSLPLLAVIVFPLILPGLRKRLAGTVLSRTGLGNRTVFLCSAPSPLEVPGSILRKDCPSFPCPVFLILDVGDFRYVRLGTETLRLSRDLFCKNGIVFP